MSLQVVPVKLLIDTDVLSECHCDTQAFIAAAIMMFANNCSPAIIDRDVGAPEPVFAEVEDSIVNGTYEPGDVFRNWIFFDKSKDVSGDDDRARCYWSRNGWDSYNMAIRCQPYGVHRPNNTAVLLMDNPESCRNPSV
jgi:hypothetical protein